MPAPGIGIGKKKFVSAPLPTLRLAAAKLPVKMIFDD
jgi:hypothetical protein